MVCHANLDQTRLEQVDERIESRGGAYGRHSICTTSGMTLCYEVSKGDPLTVSKIKKKLMPSLALRHSHLRSTCHTKWMPHIISRMVLDKKYLAYYENVKRNSWRAIQSIQLIQVSTPVITLAVQTISWRHNPMLLWL